MFRVICITLSLCAVSLTAIAATPNAETQALDVIAMEKTADEVRMRMRYLAPVSEADDYWEKNDKAKAEYYRNDYSSSAFLVRYRDRVFLLTASHVWSAQGPLRSDRRDVVKIDGAWKELPPRSERKFSTALDLAAIDVSTLVADPKIAGELKLGTADLGSKSLLFAACNPLRFAPFFLGVYEGVANDKLVVRHLGDGVQPGCSGSPVVDEKGLVRGLIVLSSGQGHNMRGHAVTADNIAKFLDVKFFGK